MKRKEDVMYNYVLRILREHETARNSDSYLIVRVFTELGFMHYDHYSGKNHITEDSLVEALKKVETIRRSRQQVQVDHPELNPTNQEVAKRRRKKQATKGTFVFREGVRTGSMF